MLQLEGVTRAFGPRVALADVSLHVARGRRVALTGANGAGKTTLLRIAAGLDAPTRGRVLLDGVDAREDGPRARARVAFLAQEPALYDALTARENLAFVARFFGRSAADITRAAEDTGASALLDERAASFSRGERQRVALARALLSGEVLLLDEPTTGLDDEGRRRLLDALAGRTALVATHDEELAKRCDATLRLQGGRLA